MFFTFSVQILAKRIIKLAENNEQRHKMMMILHAIADEPKKTVTVKFALLLKDTSVSIICSRVIKTLAL